MALESPPGGMFAQCGRGPHAHGCVALRSQQGLRRDPEVGTEHWYCPALGVRYRVRLRFHLRDCGLRHRLGGKRYYGRIGDGPWPGTGTSGNLLRGLCRAGAGRAQPLPNARPAVRTREYARCGTAQRQRLGSEHADLLSHQGTNAVGPTTTSPTWADAHRRVANALAVKVHRAGAGALAEAPRPRATPVLH